MTVCAEGSVSLLGRLIPRVSYVISPTGFVRPCGSFALFIKAQLDNNEKENKPPPPGKKKARQIIKTPPTPRCPAGPRSPGIFLKLSFRMGKGGIRIVSWASGLSASSLAISSKSPEVVLLCSRYDTGHGMYGKYRGCHVVDREQLVTQLPESVLRLILFYPPKFRYPPSCADMMPDATTSPRADARDRNPAGAQLRLSLPQGSVEEIRADRQNDADKQNRLTNAWIEMFVFSSSSFALAKRCAGNQCAQ